MSKVVTFGLGTPNGLTSRTLTVRRMMRAGDDSLPAAEHSADAGAATEFVDVTLPDNTIWQAQLADVKTSGESLPVQVIQFHTGELQHLGPKASQPDGSGFHVYAMQDISSSSSVSSSSASSSSQSSQSSVSSSSSPSSSASSSSASSVSSSQSSSSPSSYSSSSSSASSSSSESSSVSSSSVSSASSVSSSSVSSSSSASSASSSSAS